MCTVHGVPIRFTEYPQLSPLAAEQKAQRHPVTPRGTHTHTESPCPGGYDILDTMVMVKVLEDAP